MLKVTLECKNVRSENIAEVLNDFTSAFKVWFYNGALYASFILRSLQKLMDLSGKLRCVQGIEFRYIKIQKVKRLWRI